MIDFLRLHHSEKVDMIENQELLIFLQESIELCRPEKVTIITDSSEDANYVRQRMIEENEEYRLEKCGHTYHHDARKDQSPIQPEYLIDGNEDWWPEVSCIPRMQRLHEVTNKIRGKMAGREMIVSFYTIGPADSPFSFLAVQITDSFYAVHNSMLLYRPGYEVIKRLRNKKLECIYILHLQGETEDGVVKNPDERFASVDLPKERIYVYGSQYLENSVGLWKLATGLLVRKAIWKKRLVENMLLFGLSDPWGGEKIYFAGALPDVCKRLPLTLSQEMSSFGNSQVMLQIVDGQVTAMTAGQGVFDRLPEVEIHKEQVLFDAITSPGEVVVSNILQDEKETLWFWLREREKVSPSGINYHAKWHDGRFDDAYHEVKCAPRNADYCMNMSRLANVDSNLHAKEGVKIGGIFYGEMDETSVPIAEAFDWIHGVYLGTSVECEKNGEFVHHPFMNSDHMAVSPSEYIHNHIQFGENIDTPPQIFKINFTMRENKDSCICNTYYHSILLQWARGRILNRFGAVKTPIGFIPKYEDLQTLFDDIYDYHYSKDEYDSHFIIQIESYLDKAVRVRNAFQKWEMPNVFYTTVKFQIKKLKERLK